MSPKAAAGVIASVLFVIGMALGLWPHYIPAPTSSDPAATINCGNGFSPSGTGRAADGGNYLGSVYSGQDRTTDYASQCTAELQGYRVPAIALSSVGTLAGLFVLLISAKKVEPKPQPTETAPDDVTR